MPSFVDEGIIINQRKYGENSLIIKVFSRNHGIFRSFIKSAKSRKNSAIFQVGNLISFEFRSRLEDNLGQLFTVDIVKSFAADIIFNQLSLNCVNSTFTMIDEQFLENEFQNNLFENLLKFLHKIGDFSSDQNQIIYQYVLLEMKILEMMGYGIDLSSCAATGVSENLNFVSPKSAHAVSLEAGLPYQEKLLKLPKFLIDNTANFDNSDLYDALILSGFFLKKALNTESKFYERKEETILPHRSKILEALRK